MARIARFTEEQILDAALAVVVDVGPRDATLAAVSEASGAPIGSIYHRFKSKDVLMGRLWLQAAETFFASYISACEQGPGAAAQQVVRWTRDNQALASVLLLHPSKAFVAEPLESPLRDRFVAHRKELQVTLQRNTKAWMQRVSAKNRDAVRLATVEIPMGAVKERLRHNEQIPKYLESWVASAAEAVLKTAKERS